MEFERQVAELRAPLLRYAMMQLRDEALSEDVVSDTLLAILEKPDAFKGSSSLRTYATGILKHKLIDAIRRRGRELPIEPAGEEQSIDDAIDALFRADGHWQHAPSPWGLPERELEQREFIARVQACIERLPKRLGRVFMMREWLEMDVERICDELGVTANNCGVMLYRARMQLRACLEQNWFHGRR